MKNISTNSMGTRLGKAREIYSQLTSFPDYAPDSEDLTLPKLKQFLDSVEDQNSGTAVKIQEYTSAVDARQKSFLKDGGSMFQFALQMSSHVRYSFGRDSKEATAIHAMVIKIRGTGGRKKKNTAPTPVETAEPATTPDAPATQSISRRERTYGNMTKVFTDIVATLASYNGTYKGTGAFSLEALKAKVFAYKELNDKAAKANAVLIQTRDLRRELYKKLSVTMRRAKDAVSAQYSASSSQYKIVKATKV